MPRIRSVCVYCGSSSRVREEHRAAAQDLGRLFAESGVRLVYGGGRIGLMGLMADAALAAGGEVIGVIPRFLQKLEVGHSEVTELVVTETMHRRKQRMAEFADGFAILPGGLGTLDEAFEIITWKQLGLHDKPVVIVDIEGYWQPLAALMENMHTENYVRPEHRKLYRMVGSIGEVLPTLRSMPPASPVVAAKWV